MSFHWCILTLMSLPIYFLYRVELNFGQREPWFKPPPGFVFIEQVPLHQKVRGMLPPAKVTDCEVSWNEFRCATRMSNSKNEQECIPVGCVPPAAVAVPGGGLHQAPPPEQAPPPLPPLNRITDACENITLPQLRCGR